MAGAVGATKVRRVVDPFERYKAKAAGDIYPAVPRESILGGAWFSVEVTQMHSSRSYSVRMVEKKSRLYP